MESEQIRGPPGNEAVVSDWQITEKGAPDKPRISVIPKKKKIDIP
jgi:hypothetical protein